MIDRQYDAVNAGVCCFERVIEIDSNLVQSVLY